MFETHAGKRYCLGRAPAPKNRQALPLSLYLNRSALPAPQHRSWTGKISQWGMMLNDQYGCCVVAMKGHFAMLASTWGLGQTATPSDAEIKADYFTETGGVDSGLNIPASLDYWIKHPLGGRRIDAHAAPNLHSETDIVLANQLFGGVHVGVELPDDAIDTFAQGGPWTNTRLPRNPNKGHAILLVGTSNDYVEFVTWGKVQRATWAWFRKYGDEAHIVLSPDWYQGQSFDPSGVDDAALIADFQAMTGIQPPVVIQPPPAPQPAPKPNPSPAPPATLGCTITIDGLQYKATGWAKV